MQLFTPEHVLLASSYSGAASGLGRPGKYLKLFPSGRTCRMFQPCVTTKSMEAPSLFQQTKGRKENDVCHLKAVSPWRTDIAPSVDPDGYALEPEGMSQDTITFYGSSSYLAWCHNRRYSSYIDSGRYSAPDWWMSTHGGYGLTLKVQTATYDEMKKTFKSQLVSIGLYYSCSTYSTSSFAVIRGFDTKEFASLSDDAKNFLIGTEEGCLTDTLRKGIRLNNVQNIKRYVVDPLMGMQFGYSVWLNAEFNSGSTWDGLQHYTPEYSEPQPLPDHFIFNEFSRFNGTSLYLLGGGISNNEYWRQRLMQHAFLDACEKLPRLNDNTISNIKELCEFVFNLVVRRKIDIPNSWQSWWLSYRYVYNTTKLDTQEMLNYVNRHIDDKMWQTGVSSYGYSSETVLESEINCRCTIKVHSNDVDKIHDIWKKLMELGLSPDFYIIWDMIPYSFIADWFLPIGDILNVADKKYVYIDSGWYGYDAIMYSLEYIVDVDGTKYHAYTRWAEGSPPKLSGYYWFGGSKASSKVLGMRLIDSAALLIK